MMEARLPATVTFSLALHLGAGLAWLQLTKVGPKTAGRVIGDVDLLIKVRTPSPVQAPRPVAKATPPSTWNFLKMALPTVPKVAAPLELKTETQKKLLIDVPEKLDADKGRLDKLAQLEPLDLSKKRSASSALDVGKLEAANRRVLPADMPKLEEVGTRKAPPKVIAMAALEEERQGKLQPQGLSAMPELKERRPVPRAEPLLPSEQAPPPKRSALGKVADMLTNDAQPPPLQAAPAPMERPKPKLDALKQALPRRQEGGALVEKKKAMEIEGPLASRRLVYYELPTFPDWLAAQGVGEAEVRIKFFVNPAGDVLPDLRVETTSGYGRLDRLAMDSLRRWRFEPFEGQARQWGIITFRFLLE